MGDDVSVEPSNSLNIISTTTRPEEIENDCIFSPSSSSTSHFNSDIFDTIKVPMRSSILISAVSQSGKTIRCMNMLYYRHYYIHGDITNSQIIIFTNSLSIKSWENFCKNFLLDAECHVYTYEQTKENRDMFNLIPIRSIVILDDLSEYWYKELRNEINTLFNIGYVLYIYYEKKILHNIMI